MAAQLLLNNNPFPPIDITMLSRLNQQYPKYITHQINITLETLKIHLLKP